MEKVKRSHRIHLHKGNHLRLGQDIYFRVNGWNGLEFVDFVQCQQISRIYMELDMDTVYSTASLQFTKDEVGKNVFLSRESALKTLYGRESVQMKHFRSVERQFC